MNIIEFYQNNSFNNSLNNSFNNSFNNNINNINNNSNSNSNKEFNYNVFIYFLFITSCIFNLNYFIKKNKKIENIKEYKDLSVQTDTQIVSLLINPDNNIQILSNYN